MFENISVWFMSFPPIMKIISILKKLHRFIFKYLQDLGSNTS